MFHHYYELVRPSALHRYSDPYGVSIWIAPLALERLVPAVPRESLYEGHATSTPSTVYPEPRMPDKLIPKEPKAFGLDAIHSPYDASTVIHLCSSP